MAKIEDVVKQLQAILPRQTDLFHDVLAITAITNPSGTTFNIETTTVHGLTTGDLVNIENVLAKNDITTVTDLGDDVIQFDTTVDHDLTEGFQKGTQAEVYLAGFSNLTDGFFPLVNVTATNQFTATVTVVPIGSGSLGEDRIDGIIGRYTVTVIDTTNFTIEVPDAAFTDFIIVGTENVVLNIRVTGVGDPARFIEYYTAQKLTDLWAFVANGPAATSFDRAIDSDANQRKDKGDQFRYEITQPFAIFVITPTTDTFGARAASDLMVDVRTFFCKALCGVAFPSGFQCEPERFLTTYLGDEFFQYVGSYYVHQFDFLTVYNFNPGDAADPVDTRAFRCFEINFKLKFDDFTDVKKTVEGALP